MKTERILILILQFLLLIGCSTKKELKAPVRFSGIYPHLAYYNQGGECGGGAIVPWADRLWLVSYSPHFPFGSSDKLYEITPDLKQIVREESIGGTPANRMIHNESHQLFIGPYAIDEQRNVRTIPYAEAPGRFTGNARHLTDPAGKIYIATMEEGFYEADVKTLKINILYPDGNVLAKKDTIAGIDSRILPGTHGKGFYSGQGVMVYSNNGERSKEALTQLDVKSGVLGEWNGKDWKVIRRNQFMEVTGPGGIYGNKNPETDPIWANGFDNKSGLLGVRDQGKWSFYRLPKASHSYDGSHGWFTEWFRIRDIGTADKPDYLMTMHGMFWRFPGTFTSTSAYGIRPRSSYLKMVVDFTRWNESLVFSCDDAAKMVSLNIHKANGILEACGQSNSNIWFTPLEQPDMLGPSTAEGAVWLKDKVMGGEYSEPFLFAGWKKRCAWLKNDGNQDVSFILEVDETGIGKWRSLKTLVVGPGKSVNVEFDENTTGEWIRASTDKATIATVHFSYTGNDTRSTTEDTIFHGLAKITDSKVIGGLIYGLGDDRRALGISANEYNGSEKLNIGYYELDSEMKLMKKDDPKTLQFINEKISIPENAVSIEESSALVIDEKGRRWRLPLGEEAYSNLTNKAALRICREIITERELFNCSGTFYELPAESADGYAKIRPVASHNFRINDFASYRGMLIMTGIDPKTANANQHIVLSEDGKAAVWAGVIDDLWKLGKPVGLGGPWKNTYVKADEPSDPYLIGFYDHKKLLLSHNLKEPVRFRIEVDPVGHGPWMIYKEVLAAPGGTFEFTFPDNFQSRWIRFVADKSCIATAWLKYD